MNLPLSQTANCPNCFPIIKGFKKLSQNRTIQSRYCNKTKRDKIKTTQELEKTKEKTKNVLPKINKVFWSPICKKHSLYEQKKMLSNKIVSKRVENAENGD